jgi:hypothetical protein
MKDDVAISEKALQVYVEEQIKKLIPIYTDVYYFAGIAPTNPCKGVILFTNQYAQENTDKTLSGWYIRKVPQFKIGDKVNIASLGIANALIEREVDCLEWVRGINQMYPSPNRPVELTACCANPLPMLPQRGCTYIGLPPTTSKGTFYKINSSVSGIVVNGDINFYYTIDKKYAVRYGSNTVGTSPEISTFDTVECYSFPTMQTLIKKV